MSKIVLIATKRTADLQKCANNELVLKQLCMEEIFQFVCSFCCYELVDLYW